MMEQHKPTNIFLQMMAAQKITNDNIVALADNLKMVSDKIDRIEGMMAYTETEPNASGADSTPGTIGSGNINSIRNGL